MIENVWDHTCSSFSILTLLPLVPYIYISELVSIGSGNGLSTIQHQAII